MTNNPRNTITFDPDTYKKIKNIADKEGKSQACVVRDLVDEALTLRVSTENIDMITMIIREQLRDVMQPQIERLAALSAKTCVQSAASTILCAETISKLLPIELQQDFVEVYEAAKKKGVAYTKQRINLEDDD